jgi:nitrile hydratase
MNATSPDTFLAGDRVIVRDAPAQGAMPRHVRTPAYVRGHRGRIVAWRGRWPNPELLAEGMSDPVGADLFAVEFEQHELWPDYHGAPGDRVVMDLYAHWLGRHGEERA